MNKRVSLQIKRFYSAMHVMALASWLPGCISHISWCGDLTSIMWPCTQMAYGERSGDIRYGAFQTNPIIRWVVYICERSQGFMSTSWTCDHIKDDLDTDNALTYEHACISYMYVHSGHPITMAPCMVQKHIIPIQTTSHCRSSNLRYLCLM